MADITKQTSTLSIVAEFADDDTRIITIDNPVANVSASAINALGTAAKNGNILIGDKAGAAFTRFKSAKKKSTVIKNYDLTPTP